MSIGIQGATLIEQANQQVDCGEYDDAWSTYCEFRDSLNEDDYEAGALRMLEDAERAADMSFRTGAVGFESQMRTLLFVAGRLVERVETEP